MQTEWHWYHPRTGLVALRCGPSDFLATICWRTNGTSARPEDWTTNRNIRPMTFVLDYYYSRPPWLWENPLDHSVDICLVSPEMAIHDESLHCDVVVYVHVVVDVAFCALLPSIIHHRKFRGLDFACSHLGSLNPQCSVRYFLRKNWNCQSPLRFYWYVSYDEVNYWCCNSERPFANQRPFWLRPRPFALPSAWPWRFLSRKKTIFEPRLNCSPMLTGGMTREVSWSTSNTPKTVTSVVEAAALRSLASLRH